MSEYLTSEDMQQLEPASRMFGSPVPTQVVSNGEFMPARQTAEQKEVQRRIEAAAEMLAPRHGVGRRRFLASAAGMAAAFAAMNAVYGPVFDVDPADAAVPDAAGPRTKALSGQFIVDLHTHFIRDDARAGPRILRRSAREDETEA